MEIIVIIHAVNSVSTRPVTESTAAVCLVVKMDSCVIKVYFYGFDMLPKYVIFD